MEQHLGSSTLRSIPTKKYGRENFNELAVFVILIDKQEVPSGKHTKIYGKLPFSWVNQL